VRSGLYVDAEKKHIFSAPYRGTRSRCVETVIAKKFRRLTILNVQTRFGVVIPYIFFVNQLSQVLHRNDSSRRLVNSVNILAKPIAFKRFCRCDKLKKTSLFSALRRRVFGGIMAGHAKCE